MGNPLENRQNILVVNDDGIDAAGIRKLAEALSEAGNVYVCSPRSQQSACGHGITIGRPVYIEDVDFANAKQALAMEGTPADCVKFGLEVYRKRGIRIDMVFSGFNHGMNLGTDTLYSGTVSAAIEGALNGLPSAAMSICSNKSFHRTPDNFEAAMELAKKIALSEPFTHKADGGPKTRDVNFMNEEHVILNVNIPDIPAADVKGTKVCPLSYRAYNEWFDSREDEEGRLGYYYSGKPWTAGKAGVDDSDIIANELGYATITPLHFDLTDHRAMEGLRKIWNT